MSMLDIYKEDQCVGCGTCLQKCPSLKLSESESKAEIKRLRQGEAGKHIPGRCLSCFLCDELCPNGANPHSLILRSLHNRIEKKGVPFIVSFSAPLEPEPNLWSRLRNKYSMPEQESVGEWERNFEELFDSNNSKGSMADSRDYMLMGCNQWINPMVTHTEVIRDLKLAGSRDFCCGEPYYRAGMLGRAEEIFERNLSLFSECRVDKIVMFCPPGYNMFENIYPKLLGKRIAPKLITLTDWLLGRIKKGKLEIKKELNMEVWVQRNCHSYSLGEHFDNTVLELLSAIGVSVVESEPDVHPCCGLGAATTRQSVFDLARKIPRHLRSLPNRNVACYCNGCLMAMAGVEIIKPLGFRFYHILDLVSMAADEKTERKYSKRAIQILLSASSLAPKALMKHGRRYSP